MTSVESLALPKVIEESVVLSPETAPLRGLVQGAPVELSAVLQDVHEELVVILFNLLKETRL